jgi:hypothetical protein
VPAPVLLPCSQHKRTVRRLLKHLPMIDNGEVEVDSLLVHNTKIIYKCSAVSGTCYTHAHAIYMHSAFLQLLSCLQKHCRPRALLCLSALPAAHSSEHTQATIPARPCMHRNAEGVVFVEAVDHMHCM